MSFKRASPGILLCACLVFSLIPGRPLQAASAPAWTTLPTTAFASETIIGVAVSPAYALDRTLFVLTFGAGTSLWRSQDGALSWQKVLTASSGEVLDAVELSPDYGGLARVVCVLGSANGGPALWYSADAGNTWSVRPAPHDASGLFMAGSDSVLFVAGFDGSQSRVYCSSNGGTTFNAGAAAGSESLWSMALSPGFAHDRTLLVGAIDGRVYWSSDGGATFGPVSSSPLTCNLYLFVDFDENFASTRTVYVASDAIGGGIYSTGLGAGQPWQRLDTSSPADESLGGLAVSSTGVLYAASVRPVNAPVSLGGLLRCLNPLAPALFERVNGGLSAGAELLEGSLVCAGNQLWAVNSAGNRLVTFVDTLSRPVSLSSPAADASDIGELSSGAASGVLLNWQPLEGVALYQWQLSTTSDFSTVASGFAGNSAGTGVAAPSLALASAYYWRVRAIAPLYSLWSDTWSFGTTSLGVPDLVGPLEGGTALKPLFLWNPVYKASGYELVVSKKFDFTDPVVSKTGTHHVVSSYWQSDVTLEYATIYYWRVRALASSVTGDWSALGLFVTQAAPVTSTAAPSTTKPVTSQARTTAYVPTTIVSMTPPTTVVSTVAVTVTLTVLPPPSLPSLPLTTGVTVWATASQPPLTAVAPLTTSALLVVQPIWQDTPEWVYYVTGGAAGAVLLAAIILLAGGGRRRLL